MKKFEVGAIRELSGPAEAMDAKRARQAELILGARCQVRVRFLAATTTPCAREGA